MREMGETESKKYKCLFGLDDECPVRCFLAEKQVAVQALLKLLSAKKTPTRPDQEFSNIMDNALDKYVAKISNLFGETTLAEFCIACMLKRIAQLFEMEKK